MPENKYWCGHKIDDHEKQYSIHRQCDHDVKIDIENGLLYEYCLREMKQRRKSFTLIPWGKDEKI